MEFSRTPWTALAGTTPTGDSGTGLIALLVILGLAGLILWWRSPDEEKSEYPNTTKKKKKQKKPNS